jgi:hypothetical protein
MKAVVDGKEVGYFFVYSIAAQANKCFQIATCVIELEPNGLGIQGHAACSPKDRFVYEIGRKIALTRALRKSGWSKDQRRQFWKQYLDRGKKKEESE